MRESKGNEMGTWEGKVRRGEVTIDEIGEGFMKSVGRIGSREG